MGKVKGKAQVNLLLRDETAGLLRELAKQQETGIAVPLSDYVGWLIHQEGERRGIKAPGRRSARKE